MAPCSKDESRLGLSLCKFVKEEMVKIPTGHHPNPKRHSTGVNNCIRFIFFPLSIVVTNWSWTKKLKLGGQVELVELFLHEIPMVLTITMWGLWKSWDPIYFQKKAIEGSNLFPKKSI